MTRLAAACALVLAAALPASAQEEKPKPAEPAQEAKPAAPETLGEKAGYAIGVQLIEVFGEGLDLEMLRRGFEDAAGKKELKLDKQAMQDAVRQYQTERQTKLAGDNMEKAKAYLEANAKKEGVKQTASGLQYTVTEEGAGPSPSATDTVTVHYHGTFTDGSIFDSSVQRKEPASFPLNGVIKGWTEGLQLMKLGAKYTFTIPPGLAYGERGRPGIPPNSVLIFEVELLKIAGK